MATAVVNSEYRPPHAVSGSLLANIRFEALKEVFKPKKLDAGEFGKHALTNYSEWFEDKKGHREAKLGLKHMRDIMESQSSEAWAMLLDSMKIRPFFVHVVYTFILEVSEDPELTRGLKTHVFESVEQIVQQKTKLFNDLAMESLKRRQQVCSALLEMIETDSLEEDYGHTFLDGIPMIRATQDAYELVKKHFPHHNITASSNLETLLGAIDSEIVNMQAAYQDKSKHAEYNEKMLDMMTLVANHLRSQLDQKEDQVQAIDKKVDLMMTQFNSKMDQVLHEIRSPKDDKITNIEVLSSTTALKCVAGESTGASGPAPELQPHDVTHVGLSSHERKDLSGSDLKH